MLEPWGAMRARGLSLGPPHGCTSAIQLPSAASIEYTGPLSVASTRILLTSAGTSPQGSKSSVAAFQPSTVARDSSGSSRFNLNLIPLIRCAVKPTGGSLSQSTSTIAAGRHALLKAESDCDTTCRSGMRA